MKKYLLTLLPASSIGFSYLLCWMYTFSEPISTAWWFRLTLIWCYVFAFISFVTTSILVVNWLLHLIQKPSEVSEPTSEAPSEIVSE